MKNYAIWAWRPTDYNPQGQKLEFMDIRYHVQNTPQQSDKQGNDMDYFTRDLRDWANEQIEQGNAEEIITTYLAFPEEFFKKRYFYLEYLPDNNFHDFHATLIESANRNGLIVLSDFAEAVFYPDGRSEPSLAIDVIHEAQAEEIQTKLSMYGKKLEDFLEKGSVARSKIQLDVFVNLILKDYFDKKGVKYLLKKTQVTMDWQDSKIEVAVHTNFFDNKIVIQRGVTMIIPPKKYTNEALKTFNMLPFGDILWKNMGLSYNWGNSDILADNPTYVKSYLSSNGNTVKTLDIKDNQYLYQYIHYHLDKLFEIIKRPNNFYELVEMLYQNKDATFTQFSFFGYQEINTALLPTESEMISIRNVAELLRLIQHPDTINFLENYIQNRLETGKLENVDEKDKKRIEQYLLKNIEELSMDFNPQYKSWSES